MVENSYIQRMVLDGYSQLHDFKAEYMYTVEEAYNQIHKFSSNKFWWSGYQYLFVCYENKQCNIYSLFIKI